MKKVTRSLWLCLVLLIAGCGYHLPGRGDSLPEDIQRIVVEPFINRTAEPFLETQLTNEVRDQFARRRTVEVVSSVQNADAVLTGSIVYYRATAVSYDRNDDITEYRLTITVNGELTRADGSEVLWQGTVDWNEEFFASDDRAQQDNNETAAQQDATRRLAQEVYNRITDNF